MWLLLGLFCQKFPLLAGTILREAYLSTTLCIWDEAIVHFVGWSPNGEQVAFAEGEQFLSRLFVCSSDVLISTSDKSCSELLQGTEAYISASRYYLGDYGGGGVGWFQWLTDAQFIGVSLPQIAGDRFSIGTLDLGGNFRTIYQYPYPDVQIMHNIHLSQDRQRLLYRLDYYDTLHVFDLANGTDIDLGIVDSSLGANWVVIP